MRLLMLLLIIPFYIFPSVFASKTKGKEQVSSVRIMHDFTKENRKNWKLSLHNNGTEDIRIISSAYDVPELVNLSIEEARKLFVLGMQDFLNFLNSNDEIKPKLNHIPFTYKDVRLLLFSTKRKLEKGVIADSVATVGIDSEGFVTYDPPFIDSSHRQKSLFKEPYEEAYAKVFGKPYVAPKVQLNPTQTIITKLLDDFTNTVCKERGWKLTDKNRMPYGVLNKNYTISNEKISLLAVDFTANEFASFEKARKDIVDLTRDLILEVNGREELHPYINFPLSQRFISLKIRYQQDNNVPIDIVESAVNLLIYKKSEPNNPNNHPVVKEEEFIEAHKIVTGLYPIYLSPEERDKIKRIRAGSSEDW